MKFELFPFQRKAQQNLRQFATIAQLNYRMTAVPQVISFTAPTGAGKTIMLASFVESVYKGDEDYPAQSNAVFVWLSDSPELNKQSLDKFYFNSDIVDHSQLIMIEDESFNQRILDDGKIYFLNTQKLGKSSNLTKHSDSRQFTIWETLQSAIREKSDRLYFIIDEAHRGMKTGRATATATTIMQKFLKGSAEDNLSPAPLVIGMSATSERFTALVEGTTSTIHKVEVKTEEVKASGLLKDRIIVVHPDETTSSSITKDMAMLEAATDEWKNKCEHWGQYCREQHKKLFNPIFVIQVMNGTGDRISDTDLDECLKRITDRTGLNFEVGEVAHTFQTNTDLTINNLRVIYREPSQIAGDDKIKVVFFKENLSTGWDCPQAETMMSFRRARDATYIAQLLGRMIRTPMQSHIEVDDTLNDVRLYLPYFDKETVQDIVTELQSTEGGTIPTDIISESTGERVVETWGVNPPKISTTATDQSNSMSKNITKPYEKTISSEEKHLSTEIEKTVRTVQTENNISSSVASSDEKFELTNEVSESKEFVEVVESNFNRKEIVKAINDMGLLTYHIRTVRNNDYLKSLLSMAHFLTQSFLDRDALKNIRNEIINLIHSYIENLKNDGKYEELKQKAKEFKLSAQIFDVFGQTVESRIGQNMYVTTDADIERQFSTAEAKLKSDGIANAYLNKFSVDYDFFDDYKIDVILFVANNECMEQLEKFSKKRFHELKDEYRRRVAKSSARTKKEYDKIVSDGDKISEHNFTLPETISVTPDRDGKEYLNHLFVDDNGKAKIKLNTWEEGVLHEEERRTDFVCWLRNIQKQSWSLCIPYQAEDNSVHPAYPDFLIIRRDDVGYVVDILEPHDPSRRDNIGKARGFAEYAKKNDEVGRIQLIREVREGEFKRLDMSKSEIQNRVCRASSNNELDSVFDDYGMTDTQN